MQGFCAVSSMAPKRRAASAAKAGGKKVKEETQPKDAFTSAKEALLAAGPQVKSSRKVDESCSLSASAEVRSAVRPASVAANHPLSCYFTLFSICSGV